MKVLLDTHVLLWLLVDDPRLSHKARDLFLDRSCSLYFSVASLWEIVIKLSLGKLALSGGWFDTLTREMQINAVHWMLIEPQHCLRLEHLSFHHRDPFDRMLVVQAMAENMALLTSDQRLGAYAATCIW